MKNGAGVIFAILFIFVLGSLFGFLVNSYIVYPYKIKNLEIVGPPVPFEYNPGPMDYISFDGIISNGDSFIVHGPIRISFIDSNSLRIK